MAPDRPWRAGQAAVAERLIVDAGMISLCLLLALDLATQP
jgi:hypothetical protein